MNELGPKWKEIDMKILVFVDLIEFSGNYTMLGLDLALTRLYPSSLPTPFLLSFELRDQSGITATRSGPGVF